MGARTKARKRALDILYESELRRLAPGATLAERLDAGEPPVTDYTVELVRGVVANLEQLDAKLAEHAVGWTLDRMPAVDRNLLRIGAYELFHGDDVPDAVAISEAVALARQLSTEQSASFVNGLLASLFAAKNATTG